VIDANRLQWDPETSLLPCIVQHADTGAVLMLGYMNREALGVTLATRLVTFFSRSKRRLWTKGESSNNHLDLVDIAADCDADALLALARPRGPVCHLGTPTCWGRDAPRTSAERIGFVPQLERVIEERMAQHPESSYTSKLLGSGMRRIAQKVGEEGLEVALAAVSQSDSETIGEAADLLYHLLLLLKAKNLRFADVAAELESRHRHRHTSDN
jgi:phosphoribosyl-AMP cyclohydrolase / phosphoribosyl-ATP pyrophosphohydrolase